MTQTQQKVTYTTIGSSEDFHIDFDKAVEQVRKDFGKLYPNLIGGVDSEDRKTVEIRSPIDKRIVMGYSSARHKRRSNKSH